MDAYDSNDNWLAGSGWATNNLDTGQMTRLSISADNMAYVLVHDTGNYWLIDDLEVEDLIAQTHSGIPGKYSRGMETTETYSVGETKYFQYTNTTNQELIIVLNWAGSEFNIKAIKPDGSLYAEKQSQDPPIKIVILDADAGMWSFEITAFDVDINEPATLIVGSYNSDDIDNDGVANDNDNCRHVSNLNQDDFDGDGVGDACDNCPSVPNPDQEDFYPFNGPEGPGNGIGDACESVPDDIDEDGIDDAIDNCRTVPNPDQTDNDEDGIGNACDNCPDTSNPDQVDSDSDMVGDACDNCPTEPNPDQADSNGNGIGDVCEAVIGDIDGDGDVDRDDLNIILSHRNQAASVCPECDLDGDGMITALDARKLVTMCTRPRCACE